MRIIRIFSVRRFSAPALPAPPGRSRILWLIKWLLIAFAVWFAAVMLWELAFWAFMTRRTENAPELTYRLKQGVRKAFVSVWELLSFIGGVFGDLLAVIYSLIMGYDIPALPHFAAIAAFFGFGG